MPLSHRTVAGNAVHAGLSTPDQLEKLVLRGKDLELFRTVTVARRLMSHPELKELTLVIRPDSPRIALGALGIGMSSAGARLRMLELSGEVLVYPMHRLRPKGFDEELRRLLQSEACAELEEIRIKMLWIGHTGAREVAAAVPRLPQLRVVHLHQNYITDAGACALAHAFGLPQNPSCLEDLGLSCNSITREGAAGLLEALTRHPRLRNLDLSHNQLGAAGAQVIAPFLYRLRTVNLDSCKLGDEGARWLGRVIPDVLAEAEEWSLRNNGFSPFETLMLQLRACAHRPPTTAQRFTNLLFVHQLAPMNRDRYTERVELWVCRICDKDYMSKSSLNRHFTQYHEQKQRALPASSSRAVVSRDVDTFECRQCYSEYSTRSNLNRHIREVHERSPAQVSNTAVRTSTQVQNNTKNVTYNVVNNYFFD